MDSAAGALSRSSRRSISVTAFSKEAPVDSKFLLSPFSPMMKKWDLFMIVLLTFTAVVTPYEVAFLENEFNALFVINRLVDLGFILDMIANFLLGYVTDEGFVWDRKKIAARYVKSWFFIDLISILPFDIVGLVVKSQSVSQLKVS